MKKNLLMLSLLTVATLSASPVYNPAMVPATFPTDPQIQAAQYVLNNHDPQLFIDNYLAEGSKIIPDNEFTGASGNKKDIKAENVAYLDSARRFLNGETEFPIIVSFKLLRYNPDNQCFITNCLQSRLEVSFSTKSNTLGTGYGLLEGRQSGATILLECCPFRTFILDGWDNFSSLQATPDVAEALTRLTPDRILTVIANCRIIPNSLTVFPKSPSDTFNSPAIRGMKIEMLSYKIEAPGGKLPDEMAYKLKPGPYIRTDKDRDLGEHLGGRLVAAAQGYIFDASGQFMSVNDNIANYATAHDKIVAIGNSLSRGGYWWVTGSKLVLLWVGDQGSGHWNGIITYDYSLTPEGIIINGTRYTIVTQFKMDGSHIRWDDGHDQTAPTPDAPPSTTAPAAINKDPGSPAVVSNGISTPINWAKTKFQQGFQDLLTGSGTMVLQEHIQTVVPQGASILVPNPTGKIGTPDVAVALVRWVNNRIPYVKSAAGYAWPAQDVQIPLKLSSVDGGVLASFGQLGPGDYALIIDTQIIAFHVN